MIGLAAERAAVAVGQQFQVRVVVEAGFVNRVDAAQVYLEFETDELEVLSLAAGDALEYVLQRNLDNSLGRVDFAAGTLGHPVSYPFTLVTVTFRAKSITGTRGTYIGFSRLRAPRQTKAVSGGANVTGTLTGAYVVVW